MAKALVERFQGVVPCTMDAIWSRCPASVARPRTSCSGNACHRNEGIVVDTHVGRLSVRLGLTSETDPVKVEQALMGLVPQTDWTLISHLLIFHGRRVCTARAPACPRCVLLDICPTGPVMIKTKRSRRE